MKRSPIHFQPTRDASGSARRLVWPAGYRAGSPADAHSSQKYLQYRRKLPTLSAPTKWRHATPTRRRNFMTKPESHPRARPSRT